MIVRILYFALFFTNLILTYPYAYIPEKNQVSIILSHNTTSDWNSFSYADSQSFSLNQQNAADKLTRLMQLTPFEQQWHTLAEQLHQRDLIPLFEANLKSLTSALETMASFSTFYCPNKIESSFFLHRAWNNALDFIKGTKNIEHNVAISQTVEFFIKLCTSSFTIPELQQLLIEFQANVKPSLLDSQGRIRTQVTPSQWRKLNQVENDFRQKLNQWLSQHAIIQCAQDALSSTKQFKNPHNAIFAEKYLKTGPISPVLADLLNKPHFKDLFDLKNLCDQGDFEEAYQIVEKYRYDSEGFHSFGNKNYYTEYYLKRFYETHNPYGIEKKYLAHPIANSYLACQSANSQVLIIKYLLNVIPQKLKFSKTV